MKRLLSGTAFVFALMTAASAWSAVMLRPLGGPYYPESAPSPPSTIFEPAPTYSPPAAMYPYGYYAPYTYRRGY